MPQIQGMPFNPMNVDYMQWARETDYTIDVDSMRRNDIETKRDALKESMNTVVPVQLASMDLTEKAAAYVTIAEYYDSIGCPDDVVEEQQNLAAYFKQQAQLQAQMAMQMQQQQAAQPQEQAPQQAGGY